MKMFIIGKVSLRIYTVRIFSGSNNLLVSCK